MNLDGTSNEFWIQAKIKKPTIVFLQNLEFYKFGIKILSSVTIFFTSH